MYLIFLLIFCKMLNGVNSGLKTDVLSYFNENLFLASPSNLYFTLNSLEFQFDGLFNDNEVEIRIKQITFISQFYLLYSTMNKYNKQLEKIKNNDKINYLYTNQKKGLCILINMRRMLNDLLIKEEKPEHLIHSRECPEDNLELETFMQKNIEELQEANFILFYNYLIAQRPKFKENLREYYSKCIVNRNDEFEKNFKQLFGYARMIYLKKESNVLSLNQNKLMNREQKMLIYFNLYKEYLTKGIIGRWHVLTSLLYFIYQDWQLEHTQNLEWNFQETWKDIEKIYISSIYDINIFKEVFFKLYDIELLTYDLHKIYLKTKNFVKMKKTKQLAFQEAKKCFEETEKKILSNALPFFKKCFLDRMQNNRSHKNVELKEENLKEQKIMIEENFIKILKYFKQNNFKKFKELSSILKKEKLKTKELTNLEPEEIIDSVENKKKKYGIKNKVEGESSSSVGPKEKTQEIENVEKIEEQSLLEEKSDLKKEENIKNEIKEEEKLKEIIVLEEEEGININEVDRETKEDIKLKIEQHEEKLIVPTKKKEKVLAQTSTPNVNLKQTQSKALLKSISERVNKNIEIKKLKKVDKNLIKDVKESDISSEDSNKSLVEVESKDSLGQYSHENLNQIKEACDFTKQNQMDDKLTTFKEEKCLEKLYSYYLKEENKIIKENIKIILAIVLLKKLIWDKLISFQIILVGKFMVKEIKEKNEEMFKRMRERWIKLEEKNLSKLLPENFPEIEINKLSLLADKLYEIFCSLERLPFFIPSREIIKSEKKEIKEFDNKKMLLSFHFHTFSLIIARKVKIISEEYIQIPIENFNSIFEIKKENKIIDFEFFEKLSNLLDNEEIGMKENTPLNIAMKRERNLEFAEKFISNIKALKIMLDQQRLDENLYDQVAELKDTISIGERKDLKFNNFNFPIYYELSQSIYAQLSDEHPLINYLKKVYKQDKDKKGIKQKLVDWLKSNVEIWLKNVCEEISIEYGGFSTILGGSELLDTATTNSDLDIIFLIPELYNKKSLEECNACFNKRYVENVLIDSTRPCNEHDLIFGNNQQSFYSNLKKTIMNDEVIEELKINGNDVNINIIENARVPLIAIKIGEIEMDVMFANLNISNLNAPEYSNLTAYDNIENIKRNISLIDEMISSMINSEDRLYKQSILILTGYRVAYRTKFFLFDEKNWILFTNLMRVVKLWAKRKGIYSNVFGYLSGTSLIIMTAKICLLYQSANLTFLIQRFFQIYSLWEWPKPILLEPLTTLSNNNFIKSWNLSNIGTDHMPIISPKFPEQNTSFNANEFTRNLIIKEMKKAYEQFENTNSPLTENFYKELFKELNYETHYQHFLMIICSVNLEDNETNGNKTCEFLKTKIRTILNKWAKSAAITLENKNLLLIDYLSEYHAMTEFEHKKDCYDGDNKNHYTVWLVGINFKKENYKDSEDILLLIPSINLFFHGVSKQSYQLNGIYISKNNIKEIVSVLKRNECPKFEEIERKDKTNDIWTKIQVEQRKIYLKQQQNEPKIPKKNEILPKKENLILEISDSQKDFYVKIPVNSKFYYKKEFEIYNKKQIKEEEKRDVHKGMKKDFTSKFP